MKAIKVLLVILLVLVAVLIYVESQPRTVKIEKQFSIEGAFK